VIKTVMAMQAGVLPKTLHAERPSSQIDWSPGTIELLAEAEPWPAGEQPRRAAVSAFGVSGTNVHLVLEGASPDAPGDEEGAEGAGAPGRALPGPVPVVISAKSDAALRDSAARLASHLEERPELTPLDLGFSLATTRPRFEHRAVALAGDRQELLAQLADLARGADVSDAFRGVVRGERRPAFLFAGYGSQWEGMAVELLDSSPFFAAQMRQCEEALVPYVDWSLEEVLRGADGPSRLDDPNICSPALFATAVSLAKLWRACGVEPAAVVGHSQGEVVAAHIAGALSLADATHVAVLRMRAMQRLFGRGAMASVALSAAEVERRLGRSEGRLEIAAVNGPSAVVVSGEVEPLEDLVGECEVEGVRAKMIPGAVAASHSAQVESLREEMLDSLASISPRSSEIPFHSTVTGEPLDTAGLDAEYWYRNARHTVLFEPVVRGLVEQGVGTLLEVSCHPVLAIGLQQTVDASGSGDSVAVLGTLRRDEGGAERFAQSLAEAQTAGAGVDWEAFFEGAGAQPVALPTYPFQRRRFWLEPSPATGDAGAAGLGEAEHPLLGAKIEFPEDERLQLTGRLSRSTHPWLADHSVLGEAVVPGAVFVEIALAAAAAAGLDEVVELDLRAPLSLPRSGSVQIRVGLGEPGEEGSRSLAVHSRPEAEPGEPEPGQWVLHAAGLLGRAAAAGEARPEGTWPAEGAEPLDVEIVYDRLAESGFEYGPAFQRLRAAWRSGEEVLIEVAIGDEQGLDASGFGIHPALLEAAARAAIELLPGEEAEGSRLPALWRGVRLSGRDSSSLRVRVSATAGEIQMTALDEGGEPVLSIESVRPRPLERSQLKAARHRRSLHRLGWSALERESGSAGPVAILGDEDRGGIEADRYPDLAALLEAVAGGAPVPATVLAGFDSDHGAGPGIPEQARAGALRALDLAKAWIGAESLGDARLIFLTQGAVAATAGDLPDLRLAPIWGLAHSASSEHSGRFATIDLDGSEESWGALDACLGASGAEPQLAVRGGEILAPRIAPAEIAEADPGDRPFDPERTVLITGGLSGIGAAVARHLAAEHGVRHLVLASRRGAAADGANELVAELAALGSEATAAACDVADRGQLEALLDSIPPEQPLGAVIHSAAVLDNGVIELLDAERLERVMRPKVDAAWHLHELTRDLDLSRFLVFSSVAGLIGSAAQANYTAANAFLDALAAHRQQLGLPATSLAWGGWLQQTELIEVLSEVDRARLERTGLIPVLPDEGLELFDLACQNAAPLLVPVGFNRAALRDQAEAGMLPAVLGDLVGATARGGGGEVGSLRARLDGASEDQREEIVLDLVRGQAAAILGYGSGEEIGPDLVLQELGFDSLGTVELRNRLTASTGISLPILALADHPTATGIARYLLTQLDEGAGEAEAAGEGVSTGADSPGPEISFVSLLGEATRRGELDDFVELLTTASRFRVTFEKSSESGGSPRPIRLADGEEQSSLILIPSLGPASGPQEYVKLAREFREIRPVYTFPLLGFSPGEPLPGSAAAAIEAQAEAIIEADLGPEFVLGGHSSGGWLAHALAGYLAAAGSPPSALLLLDTYVPDSPLLSGFLPVMLAAMQAAGATEMRIDDARLLAMGGYRRIFAEWRPPPLDIPTAMVRAGEPAWQVADGGEWQASWPLPHTLVEAPGNHFTMMTEQVTSTAAAVLSGLEQACENLDTAGFAK
jgi:acyl transferase domain-containing protein/thioesterase domain-containing protein/acyl carrier protein